MQLADVYRVFAARIMRALATGRAARLRLLKAYCVAALGHALALFLSAWLDLPSGAAVVWTHAAVGVVVLALDSYHGGYAKLAA